MPPLGRSTITALDRVALPDGTSEFAWTSGEYAHTGDVFALHVDGSGRPLGTVAQLGTGLFPNYVQIAGVGPDFVAAWIDGDAAAPSRSIRVAAIDARGIAVVSAQPTAGREIFPTNNATLALAPVGGDVLMAWMEPTGLLAIEALRPDGSSRQERFHVGANARMGSAPVIAATSDGAMVAFTTPDGNGSSLAVVPLRCE